MSRKYDGILNSEGVVTKCARKAYGDLQLNKFTTIDRRYCVYLGNCCHFPLSLFG